MVDCYTPFRCNSQPVNKTILSPAWQRQALHQATWRAIFLRFIAALTHLETGEKPLKRVYHIPCFSLSHQRNTARLVLFSCCKVVACQWYAGCPRQGPCNPSRHALRRFSDASILASKFYDIALLTKSLSKKRDCSESG